MSIDGSRLQSNPSPSLNEITLFASLTIHRGIQSTDISSPLLTKLYPSLSDISMVSVFSITCVSSTTLLLSRSSWSLPHNCALPTKTLQSLCSGSCCYLLSASFSQCHVKVHTAWKQDIFTLWSAVQYVPRCIKTVSDAPYSSVSSSKSSVACSAAASCALSLAHPWPPPSSTN